uniref:Uncharacterized protein n=1 Tax=Anopheles atroparvus TaxID=41427 RepID=A0AAG5D0X2_ANOAO
MAARTHVHSLLHAHKRDRAIYFCCVGNLFQICQTHVLFWFSFYFGMYPFTFLIQINLKLIKNE